FLRLVSAMCLSTIFFFFFSSRRRHTRSKRDWSSDVCSSDLSLILLVLGLRIKLRCFQGDVEPAGFSTIRSSYQAVYRKFVCYSDHPQQVAHTYQHFVTL